MALRRPIGQISYQAVVKVASPLELAPTPPGRRPSARRNRVTLYGAVGA